MLHYINISDTDLKTLITDAATAYYNGESCMSDTEFDNLVDYIRIERPHLYKEINVTGWKSDAVDHLQKFKHSFNVTGLNELKSVDLERLPTANNYVISDKLDGISVVLYYEEGRFIRALTRHDGDVGLDITDNLEMSKFPRNVPKEISTVRGELVLDRDKFRDILSDSYANERNAVAGFASSIGLDIEYKKLIEVCVYDIPTGFESRPLHSRLELLQAIGFNVVNYKVFDDRHSALSYSTNFDVYSRSDKYLLDGLVCWTEHTTLKIKYQSQIKTATVIDVEWTESRLGRLIPVIITEEVYLDGAKVTRFSGFNAASIISKGIGPGAVISVCRSNMVIPHWLDTLESVAPRYPDGYDPEIHKMVGVHLEVEPDRELTFIRNALESVKEDGVGYTGIEELIEAYGLYSLKDLDTYKRFLDFEDRQNRDKLVSKVGDGVRYEKLVATLHNLFTKKVDIKKALLWSNLKGVGDSATSVIAESYITRDKLMEVIYEDKGRSTNLPGCGKLPSYVPSESIQNNRDFVMGILSLDINWEDYRVPVSKVASIKVCLTGTLSKKRGELLNDWAHLGIVEASISSADYLIASNSNSSKYKSAVSRGIPIMTEEEFVSSVINK